MVVGGKLAPPSFQRQGGDLLDLPCELDVAENQVSICTLRGAHVSWREAQCFNAVLGLLAVDCAQRSFPGAQRSHEYIYLLFDFLQPP
ncbi:hypothetical protein A2U01_0042837, partial [Trifolium medium]|nr:hypothetical protein [Trifolium medium]